MPWWKKIIQTLPYIFAGYEVGKHSEEDNSSKIVATLKSLKINEQPTRDSDTNYVEIILATATGIIILTYIVKQISKIIGNNTRRAQVEQI